MIKTKHWEIKQLTEEQMTVALEEAAELLRRGEVVAFPTETVYGLGADATNKQAIQKIFTAKGRPQDNPLIVHVAKKSEIEHLVAEIPRMAQKLIDAFSPGPITYILPDGKKCAPNVTAGLSTIAVRIPSHPLAHQLLKITKRPLAAPSANISGKPSPTTGNHVWEDLAGKISGLIDGGPTDVGMESTVVDCTGKKPIILRPGMITSEEIERVLGQEVSVIKNNETTNKPLSPGLKYRHYAPDVPLILVEGTEKMMAQKINEYETAGKRVGLIAREQLFQQLDVEEKISLGTTLEDVAHRLYDALRSFNESKVDLIICEKFPEEAVGEAIMNRLTKAANTTRDF